MNKHILKPVAHIIAVLRYKHKNIRPDKIKNVTLNKYIIIFWYWM